MSLTLSLTLKTTPLIAVVLILNQFNMKTLEYISVDFNSLKSVLSAEKRKAELENAGYNLVDVATTGLNSSLLSYSNKL